MHSAPIYLKQLYEFKQRKTSKLPDNAPQADELDSLQIFSHLIYACQIWGQNFNTSNKIQALQDKAVRIINFTANNYFGELYKNT